MTSFMEIDRGSVILADSEVSSFTEPVSEYPSSDSYMERMTREVQMELLEKHFVKELEILYNVDIQIDAVDLACSIVGRYYDVIMCKGGKTRGLIPDAEMLRLATLELLEKACLELKDDKDAELTRLDREGYLMFRNLVELCELGKEKFKSKHSCCYLLHLEKEYEILRHWWDGFLENCKAVLMWHKNPQRIAQLVQLRERVRQILKSETSGEEIIPVLRDIHTLLNEYKRSIPASLMQYRTVSPHMVAKSASLVTGVPTSWLLNSFQPPVVGLGDRLARKVVGQDHAIKRIATILSRPQPRERGPSPLASFLFLPGSSIGIKKIFESLAEELYDSKDRLIRFNLSMHRNSLSSSDVDLRDKWNATRGKVLEVVKNTPFCALLFEYVYECEYVTAFLEDILKHGKLVDAEGNTYELSNTLIMMTSIMFVGARKREALSCSCKSFEMDCPMVGASMRTIYSVDKECCKLPLHKAVLGSLWDIHQLVDDMLVLDHMHPLEPEVITRMQLREAIYASWECHRLILYPSEAVVLAILEAFRDFFRKTSLKSWLQKTVIPVILCEVNGIQADNMATIHMDSLVASKSLSYRSLEVDSALETFKESLGRWKTVYQNEKRFATEIVKLSTTGSQLLSQIQNMNKPRHFMIWLKDVKNVLDGIISDPNSSNSVSEQDLVPPNMTVAEVANRLRDYSDSNIMECLQMKLSSSTLGAKYQVAKYIAKAISSNGLDEALCCHPKSFLVLGLTDNGKADLVEALSHLFESGNQCGLIIRLNMEEYTESDSLIQFVDRIAALALDGSSGDGSSLSNVTPTSPCRVLLIDRVGEAHLSVFSALLSVLDRGALMNREGKLVDFWKTIVVVMSDLGNKDILAGLGGHAMGSIIKEANADKRAEMPFRYELLNRVDEIIMFDPLLEPQLQKFYSLPIKIGQVVERKLDLFWILNVLFCYLDELPDDQKKLCFWIGVKNLASDINRSLEADAAAILAKRKFSQR